jgi:type 1 glutamine amidotransferase
MPCPPITFPFVTSAEWDRLRAAVEERVGIVVSTDTGTYDDHGFRVDWSYDYVAGKIVVTPQDIPLACSLFESLLRHAYEMI